MKKLFVFAASAMMVFASCTDNEIVYQNETPQEIGLFSVANKMTRAAIEGSEFTHANMVVSAYLAACEGANPASYFGKTKFTKDNEAAYFTAGKYWPIQNSTLNFLAVAPEVGSAVTTDFASNVATVTVANNETNQYDVMYAVGQGEKSGNIAPTKVDMEFQHALAWVNFTFSASSSGIKINSVTVNDAKYNGTLTVTSTNYTAIGTQAVTAAWNNDQATTNAQVVPEQQAVTLTKDAAAITWGKGLLVVPCTATNFVINYSVTVGNDTHTYDYTYSTNLTWEMGKKYYYNISMGLQEIQINPSVQLWNDADGDGVEEDGEKNDTGITIQ